MMKFNLPSLFQRLGWLPAKIIMYCCFGLRVRGLEHLKNLPGNVIFAGNHVSAIDPLLILACLSFSSDKLPIIYVTHERKTYLKKGEDLAAVSLRRKIIRNDWRLPGLRRCRRL